MAKAKPSITTIERRLEYFNVTAFPRGDNGLFGEKLKAIIDNVEPSDREYPYHATSVNISLVPVKATKEDAKDSTDEPEYIRGYVQQLRTTAPSKRRMGTNTSSPIQLNDDEGIDEKTHFVYCPKTSVICVEYNYHGPKIGLLIGVVNGLYKEKIDKKAVRNSHEYIQTKKAVDKIIQKKRVKSVTAKLIDPKTTGNMSGELDLPDVFKEFKAPEHTVVEVTLKSDVKGGFALTGDAFKSLFLRNKQDVNLYGKLKVVAEDDETGKPVEYDLIKDKLNDDIKVALVAGTKEVDTNSILPIMEEHVTRAKKTYILS